jgi:hypothetical protein
MHPILNYVEFRTNHEPYVVHGVVHGRHFNRKAMGGQKKKSRRDAFGMVIKG